MTETIEYYNKNAEAFRDNTQNVVFTETQEKFIEYLKLGARILDFGCGSGRDTKYFLNRGFQTEATDGSAELVKIASEYTGIQVKQMLFQDLDFTSYER